MISVYNCIVMGEGWGGANRSIKYRIRLMFGGDFNLALWRCGSRTANNNVCQ